MTIKTYCPSHKSVERNWYVIDAEDAVLGRLASYAATLLRGKHKPEFVPHIDMGDHVIIINADKIALTGKKKENKVYHKHTGYAGGIKTIPVSRLLREDKADRIIRKAIERMISRNTLGAAFMRKLRIFNGPEHNHSAQNPIMINIKNMNRKNILSS